MRLRRARRFVRGGGVVTVLAPFVLVSVFGVVSGLTAVVVNVRASRRLRAGA